MDTHNYPKPVQGSNQPLLSFFELYTLSLHVTKTLPDWRCVHIARRPNKPPCDYSCHQQYARVQWAAACFSTVHIKVRGHFFRGRVRRLDWKKKDKKRHTNAKKKTKNGMVNPPSASFESVVITVVAPSYISSTSPHEFVSVSGAVLHPVHKVFKKTKGQLPW